MGSALASSTSILEVAGIGSPGHGGSFQLLLQKATPVTSLLPKPVHANPIQVLLASMRSFPGIRDPVFKLWRLGGAAVQLSYIVMTSSKSNCPESKVKVMAGELRDIPHS